MAHELAAELEQSIQLSVIDLEEQLETVNDEKSRLSDIVEQHKRVRIISGFPELVVFNFNPDLYNAILLVSLKPTLISSLKLMSMLLHDYLHYQH